MLNDFIYSNVLNEIHLNSIHLFVQKADQCYLKPLIVYWIFLNYDRPAYIVKLVIINVE